MAGKEEPFGSGPVKKHKTSLGTATARIHWFKTGFTLELKFEIHWITLAFDVKRTDLLYRSLFLLLLSSVVRKNTATRQYKDTVTLQSLNELILTGVVCNTSKVL